LIQFFIAGMAAMTNPEWWTYHSTWVGIFQWLVVPLPILAFIGEQPRYWRTAFAIVDSDCIAICLGTSCVRGTITHRHRPSAVNGALLLIVATFLAIGCTDRKMSA
jgi:hypothetical protein